MVARFGLQSSDCTVQIEPLTFEQMKAAFLERTGHFEKIVAESYKFT